MTTDVHVATPPKAPLPTFTSPPSQGSTPCPSSPFPSPFQPPTPPSSSGWCPLFQTKTTKKSVSASIFHHTNTLAVPYRRNPERTNQQKTKRQNQKNVSAGTAQPHQIRTQHTAAAAQPIGRCPSAHQARRSLYKKERNTPPQLWTSGCHRHSSLPKPRVILLLYDRAFYGVVNTSSLRTKSDFYEWNSDAPGYTTPPGTPSLPRSPSPPPPPPPLSTDIMRGVSIQLLLLWQRAGLTRCTKEHDPGRPQI